MEILERGKIVWTFPGKLLLFSLKIKVHFNVQQKGFVSSKNNFILVSSNFILWHVQRHKIRNNLGATTLRIMTLSMMTLSIMALSITNKI
jgi:hypothetical protein